MKHNNRLLFLSLKRKETKINKTKRELACLLGRTEESGNAGTRPRETNKMNFITPCERSVATSQKNTTVRLLYQVSTDITL